MNIAVILAGGTGTRTGIDIPKQYVEVNSRPMIYFCLETFFAHKCVHAVHIVADRPWEGYILHHISRLKNYHEVQKKFRGFSVPGVNRQMSIYHALADIMGYAKRDDRVFIHEIGRASCRERV